jgi:hypothetical protein
MILEPLHQLDRVRFETAPILKKLAACRTFGFEET